MPTPVPERSRVRACAVVVHDGQLLCVSLRDPHTRVARLFVPGGAIEPGEDPAAAAERETLEETGYSVTIERASGFVKQYPFCWNGTVYACTTSFYRGALRDPDATPALVDDAAYHEGVVWLPLASVPSELGFDETICGAVSSLIASR